MFNLIWTIISGAFVGWIAGNFMNEQSGFWKNAVIGIIGSGLAGVICNFVGIAKNGGLFGLVANVLGACLFIYVAKKIK